MLLSCETYDFQECGQAESRTGCFLELTSWGYDDDVREGSIWLNGKRVLDMSFEMSSYSVKGLYVKYRGASVLVLQRNFTTGCYDIISNKHFDYYRTREIAEDLKNHLAEQRAGAVIAVITGDEATGADAYCDSRTGTMPGTYINVVKPVLSDMGVELNGT